ncbi:MAG: PilZ domain-containing protein [Lachnospiraceae bacterium]|nr:PilZ domain-containing protein [Lachnospiraceae bacterium]
MSEKRKNKRTELESKLVVSRLDKEDGEKEVSIDVVNLSKTGIGFNCSSPLEIGSVYEGFLRIWTQEVIHAFIEIVRIEKKGDVFNYGGLFIGMPEMETFRIGVYQTLQENEQDEEAE